MIGSNYWVFVFQILVDAELTNRSCCVVACFVARHITLCLFQFLLMSSLVTAYVFFAAQCKTEA